MNGHFLGKFQSGISLVQRVSRMGAEPVVFIFLFLRAGWFMQNNYTALKIRNKNSQKWNCTASFPISAFMYLWAMYPKIGPLVFLYCGPIVGIYKLLTHEWLNLERGSAFSLLGIFVSNFRYSAFAVYGTAVCPEEANCTLTHTQLLTLILISLQLPSAEKHTE